MFVCATLIYLCSSCGCEVVLTKLNFISYISCILYASISTCRENSVKSFKYIYVYLIFMQIYMHISRGSSLYSSNLVNLFIPYSEIFKKMSKFFQSSNSKSTLCLVYKVDLKTFITPKFSVVINYQKGGD